MKNSSLTPSSMQDPVQNIYVKEALNGSQQWPKFQSKLLGKTEIKKKK